METNDGFQARIETAPQDALVLVVRGPIGTASAPQFKELLLAAVERRAPRTIVDLTQVGSIDSTGLGVLVSAAKRATLGSLALVCADEAMRNVFALVGLDRLFAVYASRQAALGPAAVALVEDV